MPNKAEKWPINVLGKYYVDQQCLACAMCTEIAPDCFAHHAEEHYAYVIKQPVTADEISRCEEAVKSCPCEAIGNDGE